MVTAESLDGLLAEVGPLDEEVVTVVKIGEGAFAVRYEDLDVLAEWDTTRNRLMLSSTIGLPPVERALRIYEILLAYNMTWEATGGIRMALNGAGGAAVQLVDLAGNEVTPRQIAIVASNLAERTRTWQSFFAQDLDVETETLESAASSLTLLRI